MCCSILQCVAVCCSVLQYVAVRVVQCCCVLKCVSVSVCEGKTNQNHGENKIQDVTSKPPVLLSNSVNFMRAQDTNSVIPIWRLRLHSELCSHMSHRWVIEQSFLIWNMFCDVIYFESPRTPPLMKLPTEWGCPCLQEEQDTVSAAVCCSVLQCVAVCCIVLQCVAVCSLYWNIPIIQYKHVCRPTSKTLNRCFSPLQCVGNRSAKGGGDKHLHTRVYRVAKTHRMPYLIDHFPQIIH